MTEKNDRRVERMPMYLYATIDGGFVYVSAEPWFAASSYRVYVGAADDLRGIAVTEVVRRPKEGGSGRIVTDEATLHVNSDGSATWADVRLERLELQSFYILEEDGEAVLERITK